jgi:4-hydroxythreonine-4-phosphate dehydrogenase
VAAAATGRPRVAITLGDPRGIGPEIVAAVLADPTVADQCVPVVVGPAGTGLPVDVVVGEWGAETSSVAEAGRLAGRAVEAAARLALAGEVEAICTAPLDKAALAAGGYPHPGHTELLADLAGTPTAMMLASDRLRVVLVTTHIPLRDVPARLTAEAIVETARLTRAGLSAYFGITTPRLALCALNPHAGDGGRFGAEDDALLRPVAATLGLAGPLPADTVFVRAMRGEFDAVLAPYHDVGMTAIKVASFGQAVNVTLGLPFVRTSPDHGTALDIAGQGRADASSMRAALALAIELAMRRRGGPIG